VSGEEDDAAVGDDDAGGEDEAGAAEDAGANLAGEAEGEEAEAPGAGPPAAGFWAWATETRATVEAAATQRPRQLFHRVGGGEKGREARAQDIEPSLVTAGSRDRHPMSMGEKSASGPGRWRSRYTDVAWQSLMAAASVPPLGVLLVEDDLRLRASLARALVAQGLVVRADVGSPREALGALGRVSGIQVALVDLDLGGLSGIDLIAEIRARFPHVPPVALTVFDDGATVQKALRAGARGYVLKDLSPAALADVVRQAADGGAPLSPGIARWILDTFRAPSPTAEPAPEEASLTAREREVVGLLCEGHTYQEIAGVLTIGLGTVQTHVKAVYSKLHVASKAELAAAAFRRGLVR
jgi:DNA-binding NarL/FixJ family response regulator